MIAEKIRVLSKDMISHHIRTVPMQKQCSNFVAFISEPIIIADSGLNFLSKIVRQKVLKSGVPQQP
jgi:hypothetical protein